MLCLASEYFNTMCGPRSKFAESNSSTIELYDDNPEAVEVLLECIYGYQYPRTGDLGPIDHINVYVTADKYRLKAVAGQALVVLQEIVGSFADASSEDEIFDLVKLLSKHQHMRQELKDIMFNIAKDHLAELFTFPEFRQMLDLDEDKPILEFVAKAVNKGAVKSLLGDRLFARCPICSETCTTETSMQVRCSGCGWWIDEEKHFSRWRRV